VADKADISQRILNRLTERVGEYKPCAVCGKHDWLLQDKFANIPLVSDPSGNRLPQYAPMMPNVALVCQNCGNTHFINLLVLGFDLKSLKADDD
jgi:translation initiation factor 2 beta subunit (eIF-2beta)/eIF-5